MSFAQSLIRNGDFEEGNCPETRNGTKDVCENWFTISTADYFSECSKGEVNPHKNFRGHQTPYSGISYVGIFSGKDSKYHISEILFTELVEPLQKGYKYKISFWYSLSDSSSMISKSLGCAFSTELAFKEVSMGHSPIFKLNYSLVETNFNNLSNDSSWSLFEKEYVALGNEKYLYISGLPVNGVSCIKRKVKFPIYNEYAYYYIDQVTLFKQNSDGTYPQQILKLNQFKINEYSKNFFSVYFDIGSSQLSNKSTLCLDTLITILKNNPTWTINISGHTDASGNEKNNIILSKDRSNVVKEYFLSKGIDSKSLEVQSLGSSEPFSMQTSEVERAKNRRVEILIKK